MTSTATDRVRSNSSNAIKSPCACATTANITLAGEQIIDGVQTNSSRVLVKNQTNGADNAIYRSATSNWTREPDFDGNGDVVTGTLVSVNNGGTTNGHTMWRVTTTGTILVGSTALTFELAAVNDSSTMTFLQAGTGAVARPVRAKEREVISPTDFYANGASGSAVVGDGATICTLGIQAALNAASGKTLQFPAGSNIYFVDDELVVGSNTVVNLNGNTIKQAAGARTQNGIFYVGTGISGVVIENGTIDINVSNQSYTGGQPNTDYGRGVFIYQASDVEVCNINFINPYGSMVLAAASTRVLVEGCDINDASGTGTNAIVFNTCTYCDAIRNTGTGKLGVTGFGIYGYGTSLFLRALDNVFNYWQIAFIGVDYITGGGSSGMRYCQIDRNTLNAPSADTSIQFGLYGSVCDNVITDARDVGISVDFSRNLVVNDNIVRTTNAAGIAIPGCVDCVVVGNMISNPGSQFVSAVTNGARSGIWAPLTPTGSPPSVAPSGNVIESNTIRDSLGSPQMYYGISVADNAGTNTNFVKGNYIAGATQASLDLPTQTNVGFYESLKAPAYQNSWVDYGGGFKAGGYYKSEDGTVFLTGMIKSGTVGATIFTLPVGYRPVNQLLISVISNGAIGRLDIFSSGDVVLTTGSNAYVSLNGINFPTR